MKKKKAIIFLMTLVLLIGGIFLVNNIYQNKNKINKTKRRKQNNLAIMIKEEGASDYTKSSSNDIPIGNYVLNEDKTHCENNGKILSYDNTTGKVKFSFVGSDRCYLYFDYKIPYGWETILINNGNGATSVEEAKTYIEGRGTPDFSKVNDAMYFIDGMYAAQDDLGTSYYFSGDVYNNWIKYGKYTKNYIKYRGADDLGEQEDFNSLDECQSSSNYNTNCEEQIIAQEGDDIYWQIVRINGDNSIRLIYAGTELDTVSNIGYSHYNGDVDDSSFAEEVGYMYAIGQQHGTSTDSAIKKFIDNWFANYTDLNKAGTKVTDTIYCNDRTVSTTDVEYSTTAYTTIANWSATTYYYYGPYGRNNKSSNSILTCPVDNDRFTVNKINNIGNSALTYPVGLLTADELKMTGPRSYINNNIDYFIYSLSPYDYDGTNANIFYFDASLGSINSFVSGNVRPVISLSPDVKLTGDGTLDNVYEVQ